MNELIMDFVKKKEMFNSNIIQDKSEKIYIDKKEYSNLKNSFLQ